jgi:hypothetical protein
MRVPPGEKIRDRTEGPTSARPTTLSRQEEMTHPRGACCEDTYLR